MAKAFIVDSQLRLLRNKLNALFLLGAASVLLLPPIVVDNRCLLVSALPTGHSELDPTENPPPVLVQDSTDSISDVTTELPVTSSSEIPSLASTKPPIHRDSLSIHRELEPNQEYFENQETLQKVHFALEIVIRVSIFLYCCLVIGYLCDEFFVPSLECIGESLNLPNDLIGAILIPFGTSGPEIFSSAVGVFFAENDIGTGAIIGSAVFNILAIPAASGLAAAYFIGDSIRLDEKPILRDLSFYIVSIIVLILVIKDNTVDLIDSSLLAILFVIYISVMLYTSHGRDKKHGGSSSDSSSAASLDELEIYSNGDEIVNNNQRYLPYQQTPLVTIHNDCGQLNNVKKEKNLIKEYLNKCNKIIEQQYEKLTFNEYYIDNNLAEEWQQNDSSKLYSQFEGLIARQTEFEMVRSKMEYEKLDTVDDNGFGFTDNLLLRILLMPFIIIFGLTMPRRFPYITFILSIGWLSVLSYGTVWSISGLSEMVGIPPTISGMTILAAGSAVPDLVTSIIVIKKTGTASMGICAGIASNIFAILLGLGLPWGIQFGLNWANTAHYASSVIRLQSSALPFTSIILLATIVALYFTFRICNWTISKRFSLICVLIHIVFIVSSTALEVFVS